MVRLDGARVLEIVDNPKLTDLKLMWGCILWRPRFTEFLHHAIQQRQLTDFAEIMNEAILSGLRFRGVLIPSGNYIDLGTYQEIMELDSRLRGG